MNHDPSISAPQLPLGKSHVGVPEHLFSKMARCYYGGGPRFMEPETPAPLPEENGMRTPETQANDEGLEKNLRHLRALPGMRPTGAAARRYLPKREQVQGEGEGEGEVSGG